MNFACKVLMQDVYSYVRESNILYPEQTMQEIKKSKVTILECVWHGSEECILFFRRHVLPTGTTANALQRLRFLQNYGGATNSAEAATYMNTLPTEEEVRECCVAVNAFISDLADAVKFGIGNGFVKALIDQNRMMGICESTIA